MLYLEAQASGCVLLASDIPAAREVVVHDQSGVLFPMGDVDALSALTLALAADPERRARIRRQARAQVTRYTLDQAIESYLDLFRMLVS